MPTHVKVPAHRAHLAPRLLVIAGLLAVVGGAEALEDDDEDFNAIARKERDPYRVNDFRLVYTMLPAHANVSIMDPADETNPDNYRRETNWDLTGRTSLTWMTPWSGVHENGDFILGLEVGTNRMVIEASNVSPNIDVRSYQVTLHPGLSWLLDDNFHIEINPFIGAGQAEYELDIAGSGSDLYWEFGLRFAAFYTWDNGFQLGMQTGYLYGRTRGDLDGDSAVMDTEIEVAGMFMGLSLGLRL